MLTTEQKLTLALEALKRIRDARDYNSENGHYPPAYGIHDEANPESDTCFDDWAADIADTVLQTK